MIGDVPAGWRPLGNRSFEDPATGDRLEAWTGEPDSLFVFSRLVVDGVVSVRTAADDAHRSGMFTVKEDG